MKINIISEFKKKSKAFKITAAVAAVVIVVLGIIIYMLNPNIPAESISFEDSKIYLQKDMTYTLKTNLKPYNTTESNLIYRISDPDVISLNGNKVTALRRGTAEIYCYDKKSKVKSNVISFEVVKSIEKLVPQTPSENEEVYIADGDKPAIYVYYTTHGEKYHKKDCSFLGENPVKGILNNVKESGLTPCSRCNP
ncbi:MAG: hypothetical protein J6A69_01435 [Clostridia bacterium]|nr:hypothetical protein [Clostridia bacterium]